MDDNSSKNVADNQFEISESSYKTTHTAVRKARRFALQGLYEWLMTDHRFDKEGQNEWKANAPHDIAARTRATNAMHTVHLGYYHEMMRYIPQQIDDLEALIGQHLDRDISQIDQVEHAVLLIGAYELKHSLHIPYKVVLDEAMKLNTHFGATDAHKLINAVMDKLAAELRAVEVKADGERSANPVHDDTEQTQQIEVETKTPADPHKTGEQEADSQQAGAQETDASSKAGIQEDAPKDSDAPQAKAPSTKPKPRLTRKKVKPMPKKSNPSDD